MKWMSLLPTIWRTLPATLQRAVAIGTAILLITGGLMLLGLVWSTGVIQHRMEQMLTKEDLRVTTHQLNSFSPAQLELMDSVMHAAILANDIEMRIYLAEERRMALDTAYIPLLRLVKTLVETQNRMLGAQNRTDASVRQLPIQFDEKLDRALAAAAPEDTKALLQKAIDKISALEDEVATLREESRSGRRTNKVKF